MSGDEADDVMDASPGLGRSGGRRGCGPDYVTSSLCAPPPGATLDGKNTGRFGRDFPHSRDPWAPSCGWPLASLLPIGVVGHGLLVNGEPPRDPPQGCSCARVCVMGGVRCQPPQS